MQEDASLEVKETCCRNVWKIGAESIGCGSIPCNSKEEVLLDGFRWSVEANLSWEHPRFESTLENYVEKCLLEGSQKKTSD